MVSRFRYYFFYLVFKKTIVYNLLMFIKYTIEYIIKLLPIRCVKIKILKYFNKRCALPN